MKTINISADVYAAIWRNHRQGEETEDEILKRLLLASGYAEAKPAVRLRKTNFEDVVTGLGRIDGAGHLSAIYDSVLAVRKENGHRIPVSAEAIVRRTLEENSSQTESFKGKQDLFVRNCPLAKPLIGHIHAFRTSGLLIIVEIALKGEHVRGKAIKKHAIVRDHHRAAAILLQRIFQRGQRLSVQIVGRLIEQQHIGAGFQNLGQMHPVALTT
jgi:hypothetical protein